MKKAILVGAALALASCGQGGNGAVERADSQASSEVVATVGARKITLAELEKQLDAQPIVRSRLTDLERKKEFVENAVRFELLAREAQRRGLDRDPEVREAVRRAMVQKLTQDFFKDVEIEVTDEEARQYYQDNLHDYVKPPRVRLSHVFFEAPQGSARRDAVRAEAQRALTDLRKKDRAAFAAFAKERSDDARSKRAGGDLSFQTEEELARNWGEEFARAAFSLRDPGQFADLVATEKGFHVVKLLGRQEGVERSFESVRNTIVNRIEREKRTKAFEAFVEDLREKTKPMVDEEVVAKLQGGSEDGVVPTIGRPIPANPPPAPAKAE